MLQNYVRKSAQKGNFFEFLENQEIQNDEKVAFLSTFTTTTVKIPYKKVLKKATFSARTAKG